MAFIATGRWTSPTPTSWPRSRSTRRAARSRSTPSYNNPKVVKLVAPGPADVNTASARSCTRRSRRSRPRRVPVFLYYSPYPYAARQGARLLRLPARQLPPGGRLAEQVNAGPGSECTGVRRWPAAAPAHPGRARGHVGRVPADPPDPGRPGALVLGNQAHPEAVAALRPRVRAATSRCRGSTAVPGPAGHGNLGPDPVLRRTGADLVIDAAAGDAVAVGLRAR